MAHQRDDAVLSTTSLDEALALGYIGEMPIELLPLVCAVRQVIGYTALTAFIAYFCGDLDADTEEMFSYA